MHIGHDSDQRRQQKHGGLGQREGRAPPPFGRIGSLGDDGFEVG